MYHIKYLLIAAVLTIGISLAEQPPAPTRHVVVAVAPNLPESVRRDAALRVSGLFQSLPPGTPITLLDAGRLVTVVRQQAPVGSRNLRQQRAAAGITAAVRLCLGASNHLGVFNPPALLDHIARQIHTPGADTDVWLLGPCLYANPAEPAFAMSGGTWPSDGHLGAGRVRSVFSTRERGQQLNGLTIHWFVTDLEAVANEAHREGVTRFWALYAGTQSGRLGSFSGDLANVADHVEIGWRTPLLNPLSLDPDDTGVTMRSRRVERREVATPAAEVPAAPAVAPVHVEQPQSPAPTSAPAPLPRAAVTPSSVDPLHSELANLPRVAAGNVALAILWKPGRGLWENSDVDLYVQPGTGPELSFRLTETDAGKYHRDVIRLPADVGGPWKSTWEFVELSGDSLPVSVWLNLFSGRGPVSGHLRLEWRGKLYAAPFRIEASEGDGSKHSESRNGRPEWVQVDLADVLRHPLAAEH